MFSFNKSDKKDLMVSYVDTNLIQELGNITAVSFDNNHIAIEEHAYKLNLGYRYIDGTMIKPVRNALSTYVLKLQHKNKVFYYIISEFDKGDMNSVKEHFYVANHVQNNGNFKLVSVA